MTGFLSSRAPVSGPTRPVPLDFDELVQKTAAFNGANAI